MRQLIPALLLLAFTVYCLVDVVRSEGSDVRGLPKPFWVVLVLLLPLVGGIAWFVAGRPRGTHRRGPVRPRSARPPVVGPDDDPDFLRTIDRPRPVAPAEPLDPSAPGGPTTGSSTTGSSTTGSSTTGSSTTGTPAPGQKGADSPEGSDDPRDDPRDDRGPGTAADQDDRRP